MPTLLACLSKVRLRETSKVVLQTTAVFSLPEQIFKFALNAVTDTLPHNQNLFLWKKVKLHLWKKLPSPNCPLCSNRQTLLHTLNHCPGALQCRCYNQHHDAVLELLHQFTCNHTSPQQQVTVDLPDQLRCWGDHRPRTVGSWRWK